MRNSTDVYSSTLRMEDWGDFKPETSYLFVLTSTAPARRAAQLSESKEYEWLSEMAHNLREGALGSPSD